MTGTRVLIVVLDALRPDFVTPELMPALSALAARGSRFAQARATFPTETRVNQSAVTTGCYPHRHGVVANRFRLAETGDVLNTGDDVALAAALDTLPGPLLGVETMGEILNRAGRSYASLSSGTPGGGRLINIAAEHTGQARLALKRPEAACPGWLWPRVTDRLGPPPPYERPANAWNSYAVQAYLQIIEPEVRPDVMLLWLCEPDESFHWHGIGSPESLAAIRHQDALITRLLDAHAAEIDAGDLHLIVMADHGQVSLTGEKLGLSERLAAAGFPDTDVVVHNAGGLWLADPGRLEPATAWLRAQPWCGPLFTRDGVEGTLPLSALHLDHARAPDIALALAGEDGPNAWGHPGLSADNAPYPTGGGCHGGLSRYELETTLILAGERIRTGTTPDGPAGNVDILPTVLHLLDLAVPDVDGRVLTEALVGDPMPPDPTHRTMVADGPGPRTHLSLTEIGTTRYLNRAWLG